MVLYAILQPPASISRSASSIHDLLKISQNYYSYSPVPRTFIEHAMHFLQDPEAGIDEIKHEIDMQVGMLDRDSLVHLPLSGSMMEVSAESQKLILLF